MANTFKNYLTSGVGTAGSTVYNPTTSGIQSTVIGLSVANTSTNPVSIDVTLTSGGTTVYLVKGGALPANQTLFPIGGAQKVVLEQNDSLSVKSSTDSTVDVIVSVLEIA